MSPFDPERAFRDMRQKAQQRLTDLFSGKKTKPGENAEGDSKAKPAADAAGEESADDATAEPAATAPAQPKPSQEDADLDALLNSLLADNKPPAAAANAKGDDLELDAILNGGGADAKQPKAKPQKAKPATPPKPPDAAPSYGTGDNSLLESTTPGKGKLNTPAPWELGGVRDGKRQSKLAPPTQPLGYDIKRPFDTGEIPASASPSGYFDEPATPPPAAPPPPSRPAARTPPAAPPPDLRPEPPRSFLVGEYGELPPSPTPPPSTTKATPAASPTAKAPLPFDKPLAKPASDEPVPLPLYGHSYEPAAAAAEPEAEAAPAQDSEDDSDLRSEHETRVSPPPAPAATDDLDALLASLGQPAPVAKAKPAPVAAEEPPAPAATDDLDALLASLETKTPAAPSAPTPPPRPAAPAPRGPAADSTKPAEVGQVLDAFEQLRRRIQAKQTRPGDGSNAGPG